MTAVQATPQKGGAAGLRKGLRIAAAAIVIVLAAGYLLGVLSGWVTNSHRLGLTEIALALIAVGVAALLIQPEMLDAVSRFQFGGLQVELRQLREGVQTQSQQLDEMRFLILLLMTEKQRKYLTELSQDGPALHNGDAELRDALRSLRSAGLIKMKGDHHVSELKDGVIKRDIRELVEITDDGRRLVQRIGPPAADLTP